MITFGKLIKDTRIRMRLTQKQVAERAGNVCTNVNVSYIEKSCDPGRKPIRPAQHIVDALAIGLGIPLKTAREAANYAAPFIGTAAESSTIIDLTELFAGYERLESPYREQAVGVCAAVFEKFYEIQMGYIGNEVVETSDSYSPAKSGAAGGGTLVRRIPVIYAETENEYRAEEEQREREEQFMHDMARKRQDDDAD